MHALSRYRPLFYNLGDEPGIADLTAFWDFDFSPASLAAMRKWLRTRYRDLAHLNDQWGSTFRSWDEVVPMTTNDAMRRTDQNFSAWGDFKEWMDVAFARALKSGSDAVHAADPAAVSAIEGAQIPGWGGYDYSRLATSVDAMELGDEGDSVEMLRSFNPNAVMLTTSFGGGAAEEHRVWRELLRGTRGLIHRGTRTTRSSAPTAGHRPAGPRGGVVFSRDPRRSRRVADQQPPARGPDRDPLFSGQHADRMAAR